MCGWPSDGMAMGCVVWNTVCQSRSSTLMPTTGVVSSAGAGSGDSGRLANGLIDAPVTSTRWSTTSPLAPEPPALTCSGGVRFQESGCRCGWAGWSR